MLSIRLLWTAKHKLDYVALDISKEKPIQVHICSPTSVVHSKCGSVSEKIIKTDKQYVELLPGEENKTAFVYKPLSNNSVRL